MEKRNLIKKAERNLYRVVEDPQFWTPEFCRTFFDWCDTQALEVADGLLIRGELALELAKKTDDRHVIAKAHGVKASAYRMLSFYEHCEAELSIAFRHAESCPCCLGELNRRQGILSIHQRRFNESIPFFDSSVEHCLEIEDNDGVGRTLVSRGVALWRLNRIDEALHDEHRALPLLSPQTPIIYHLGVLTNITACLATGSEEHFSRASDYCIEFRNYLAGLNGLTSFRVRLSWTHGLVLARLGERKRGLQMLRKARKALIHARQDSEVVAITADISKLYCDTRKYRFIAEMMRELLAKLGDVSNTRPLLKKTLYMAERELAETSDYVIELRAAVCSSIPCLLDASADAFSTP